MVERLHKLGGVPTDRAELMLEAMAALLETKELQSQKCPRGHFASRPPVQIHVHENAETGRMTVQTDAGERELSRAESERMRCDAAVCEHGGRNTTTIPPRVRREVLTRDNHRCQAPGCGRTRFLEVHHIVARRNGGSNQAENLTTLCAACHRLYHERGVVRETPPRYSHAGYPTPRNVLLL
jgi:5-methylcytosine-specific restriction endonuclease McrA